MTWNSRGGATVKDMRVCVRKVFSSQVETPGGARRMPHDHRSMADARTLATVFSDTNSMPPTSRRDNTFKFAKATKEALFPVTRAYDTLHIHWNMGTDPLNPTAIMVHAPECGEACVHIHWRWGVVAGTGWRPSSPMPLAA